MKIYYFLEIRRLWFHKIDYKSVDLSLSASCLRFSKNDWASNAALWTADDNLTASQAANVWLASRGDWWEELLLRAHGTSPHTISYRCSVQAQGLLLELLLMKSWSGIVVALTGRIVLCAAPSRDRHHIR